VEELDAQTLLPIIQKHVLPGTTIHSDSWELYSDISLLPEGYIHLSDPDTASHTQHVHNQWSSFKGRISRSRGLNTADNDRYMDYLEEFMWRQEFRKKQDLLYNFWSHVVTQYPCEQAVAAADISDCQLLK
jgi:transposase-like protein